LPSFIDLPYGRSVVKEVKKMNLLDFLFISIGLIPRSLLGLLPHPAKPRGRAEFSDTRSLLWGSSFFVLIVSMAPMLSFAAQNKENKTKETELATLRQSARCNARFPSNDIAQAMARQAAIR